MHTQFGIDWTTSYLFLLSRIQRQILKFCIVLSSAITRYSAENSTQLEFSFNSNSEIIYLNEPFNSENIL